MKSAIVLWILFGYVYSAPSACNGLCGQIGDANIKTSESLQTYQAHSSLSGQNALRNHQSLTNQLHAPYQLDMKLTHPTNWTELNDFVNGNDAESLHKERGQLVNNTSKVHYYKKNYESSYNTGTLGATNFAMSSLPNDHLNIHDTVDWTNVQNHQQSNYDNKENTHLINHSFDSSSTDNFSRLENLGEQIDTRIHENSNSGVISNTGDNWTRHNVYSTDGGRGKVYEEEGQYNQGPAKVRYYKRNYTSNFSMNYDRNNRGDAMMPTIVIPNINTNIDSQIQLKSQSTQINSHMNKHTRLSSTSIDDSDLHQEHGIHGQHDYAQRNHIRTDENVSVANHDVITRDKHNEKYSSSQKQHNINTYDNFVQMPLSSSNQYSSPLSHIHSTNTHRQVEQRIYVPASNINNQMYSHTGEQHQRRQNYHHNEDTTVRIPIYRQNERIYTNGDTSSYSQNQHLHTNVNSYDQGIYNLRDERITAQPYIGQHVEHHWSASQHRSHSTIPQQPILTNQRRILDDQHLELLRQRQGGSLISDGYENINVAKLNNYAAGSSSYRQSYGSEIHHSNVQSKTDGHRYHDADCDGVTHIKYDSKNDRIRYKRDTDHYQHNQDLSQQAEFSYNQNYDSDRLQKSQKYHGSFHQTNQQDKLQDDTQQHMGNMGPQRQKNSHQIEDYTQQHTGNVEFDQQYQSSDGKLEVGKQIDNHNHHEYQDRAGHHISRVYKDHDSTHNILEFDDYTQKHTENLEHVQQNGHLTQQYQPDRSTIEHSTSYSHWLQQQRDVLSQQTFKNFEFAQHDQNTDDMSNPAPKPIPRLQRIGDNERGDIEIDSGISSIGVKGDRRTIPVYQDQFNAHYSQPINEQSQGVLSLEQQIKKNKSTNFFQPRILEAYGGNGPYDANHYDNIYIDATSNALTTLSPIVDGIDPWDVREVSPNDYLTKSDKADSLLAETSSKIYHDDITTTLAPGFWKRIGHKITSTYENAKDKVFDVFG